MRPTFGKRSLASVLTEPGILNTVIYSQMPFFIAQLLEVFIDLFKSVHLTELYHL